MIAICKKKNIVKEVMLIGGMVKFISITTRMKKIIVMLYSFKKRQVSTSKEEIDSFKM